MARNQHFDSRRPELVRRLGQAILEQLTDRALLIGTHPVDEGISQDQDPEGFLRHIVGILAIAAESLRIGGKPNRLADELATDQHVDVRRQMAPLARGGEGVYVSGVGKVGWSAGSGEERY